MLTLPEIDWTTDADLFAALPGGREVIDWFGFRPSFHDATLAGLEIAPDTVTLRLDAFRITSEIDAEGYYVQDRHARVTLRLSGVTGIALSGHAASIIGDLGIRRLTQDAPAADWWTSPPPRAGDYEVAFEASYGLQGSLFAREVALELEPRTAAVAEG